MPSRVLADDEHLSEMRLGLCVTFESILVSALLLADLAVPPQPLKTFGLHLVGQILWRSDCCLCQRMSMLRPNEAYLLLEA